MKYRGRIVGHENLIVESLEALAQEKDLYIEYSRPQEWGSTNITLASVLEDKDANWEANFSVQQLPGCCGVLVIYYVRVKPFKQATFDMVLQLIETAAKEAGFGSLQMAQTVPAYSWMLWKDEPWIKCLDRGWRYSPAFRNRKSNNLITYLTMDMKQPIEKESTQEGSSVTD